VHDRVEQALPSAGLIKVRDPESGAMYILDSHDPAVRSLYARDYQKRFLQFKEQFKRAKCDVMTLATNQSYIQEFHRFFKSRAHA
jgi:uncharacterized protein (DUF58 family)